MWKKARIGLGYPHQDRTGVPSMRQNSKVNTYYVAGGIPLVFTQEDFLVEAKFHIAVSIPNN